MINPASEGYHQPVLAAEVIKLLVTDPVGVYMDLTVGGGGHLKALASVLDETARMYGVDKDPEAVAEAERALSGVRQCRGIYRCTFSEVARAARHFGVKAFEGIMLDLGLSSHQIDDPSRGFSFQADGPLDMRFTPDAVQSAADLVNTLDESELRRIFREYGEERGAAGLARAIVRDRQKQPIRTTGQLATIVTGQVRPPHQTKSLARVFQSLRIAVNGELDELQKVLPEATELLKPGGRLAVISYHSLEDRLVKRFFQKGAKPGLTYGYPVPAASEKGPVLRIITKKPVVASEGEVEANSRARSAKLRVAEKL